MTALLVRRLDDGLVRRLKQPASADGRSAEAEHRAILEAALRPQLTGRQLWDKLARGEKAELALEETARADIEATDFG
jgi:plasmid stability protein